jgi:pimeloyl-ACP methyl ester carboxylesterase
MASDWIDGYRKPSIVRDWDVGMFRVVLASVVAANSPREIWRDAMARARATTPPSTLEREDAVTALVESGAKILIVHGENDVIVPVSNSRALAELLNCELRVLPKTGHMPHEESPDAFVDALRDFMS